MSVKISHSAIQEYNTCSMKYKLNRIDKIRPKLKSSAFIFGSAIDNACEAILNDTEDYKKVFESSMKVTDINKEDVEVEKSELIKYFSKDLQEELLTEEQLELNYKFAKELEFEEYDHSEFIVYCKNKKRNKKRLEVDEQKLFNQLNYFSLLEKGKMLLDKFKEWSSENIKEVHSIQREIKLENADGDILRGYLDFDVTMKDGVRRIIDLKTASDPKKQYPDGCADEAQQLAIYASSTGIFEVGYYVLDKSIRKKEPRVRDRYVTGSIKDLTADKIFDNIEESLENIKNQNFEHNWDACVAYGGCEYFNYCKSKNKDMRDLIKLGDK